MGHGLSVCCNSVMFGGGKVDMSGAQAGEDILDFVEVGLGGAVLDENLIAD